MNDVQIVVLNAVADARKVDAFVAVAEVDVAKIVVVVAVVDVVVAVAIFALVALTNDVAHDEYAAVAVAVVALNYFVPKNVLYFWLINIATFARFACFDDHGVTLLVDAFVYSISTAEYDLI